MIKGFFPVIYICIINDLNGKESAIFYRPAQLNLKRQELMNTKKCNPK